VRTRLTPYQRRLCALLSVATFFEGYDLFALAQILPNLRAEFGLAPEQGGVLVAVANLGAVLAFVLVRAADRVARRSVLALPIAGYTAASFATAFAPNAWAFAVLQLAARTFLLAEYALAIVYAAEEFPADRRGTIIGVIQGASSLGAIACSALVPWLLRTPLGWRSVFLVGAAPLLLVAYARRGLRETARFQQSAARDERAAAARLFVAPYRRRVVLLAAIWALTLVCTQSAVTFWKEFAVAERGMSDSQVGTILSLAAIGAMPCLFFAGSLIDRIGRRRGAAVVFGIAVAGVLGSYTLVSPHALTAALGLGIFGSGAVQPVLNAFTTELFPTNLRSQAFAWTSNLLGRSGALAAPLAVSAAAGSHGWALSVSATAIFPLIALGLIAAYLPETAGRELEETAA